MTHPSETAADMGLTWFSAQKMRRRASIGQAVDMLEETLCGGYDPEQDGERTRLNSPYGQLLQMPSASRDWLGTKLVSLRPGNEDSGQPVIQGVYILFDGPTMTPVAVLDGAALTTLRTPAVTALAVRHLAPPQAHRAVIFGTGVQAHAHVEALQTVIEVEHIDVVGRSPQKVQSVVETAQARGIRAAAAGPESVAQADVVICCTSSPAPLFDSSLVPDGALVAAIGSHDPESRETDTALVRRAGVVVESLSSAQREAGDLIIPAEQGDFDWDQALTLKQVVAGVAAPAADRPRFFKGTGMPWQDLAVVAGIYAHEREQQYVR